MFWRSFSRRNSPVAPRCEKGPRRKLGSSRAVLGLESLEDRLALAVTIELDASQNLVVTGDDSANAVIIEQRGAGNTLAYVWVNGKAQNKGKAYDVQGGQISVDLMGGNDSLTIRAQKGKAFTEGTTDYAIDLGAGNDSLTFAPNSMTFSDVVFSQLDLGAGNDKATFTPGAMNGGSLKFGEVLGGDGNDVFTLTMGSTRNYTSIGIESDGYIDLGAGDDTFAWTWVSLVDADVNFSSPLTTVGVDLGLGADKLSLIKGAVTRGSLNFSVDLGDKYTTGSNEAGVTDGVNVATIYGEGIVSDGATVAWAVFGGGGRDAVTFDDDRIFSDNTLVSVLVNTGAGDDVVTFDMDSNKKAFEGIGTQAASNAAMEIEVILGDGNDKFMQTFDPRYWRLQNGAVLTTTVDAGAGNDEVWVNKAAANTLNLDGTFDFKVLGGAGDDLVDVNLGSLLRIGVGYFHIDAALGAGKDTFNFTGYFETASRKDPTFDVASAVIDLLMEADVDKVWVNINNKSPNLTVFVNANGGGQAGDTFAKNYIGDVKGVVKGFDGLPPVTPPVTPPVDPPVTPPTGTNPTSSSTTTTPTATGAVATTTVVTTSAKETIITTVNTSFDKTTGATTTATNTVVVPLTADTTPASATTATSFATTTATGKVVTTIITTILPTEIKTTTVTTTTTNATAQNPNGSAVTTSATTSTPRT